MLIACNLVKFFKSLIPSALKVRVKRYLGSGHDVSWRVRRLSRAFHYGFVPSNDFEVAKYMTWARSNPEQISPNCTALWARHLNEIERLFVRKDRYILRNAIVRFAIFLHTDGLFLGDQIRYLEAKYDLPILQRLLLEDHVLFPLISEEHYHTSEMLAYHLTHLTLFSEKSGINLSHIKSVFEFGGGYGSMCRLMHRFSTDTTYVITDFPIMLFLQSYFLKNVLPPGRVNLILNDDQEIRRGMVNLVPIGFGRALSNVADNFHPDLFLATWSLSEATREAQENMRALKYMNAKYILYGYYGEANDLLPNSTFSAFDDFDTIYHERCFFDRKGKEIYHFLEHK